MTLKAIQGDTLSSGELKLYGFNENEQPVGCIELYNYDPINRRSAVGIVVSNEFRHQGYGKAMVAELTNFCKHNTSLHQLYADIAATNAPSIHIFSSAGYQHCATLKDWVMRGENYIDTYRFQLILN
ncbi:MAG: GNAT family N-acetyltransferase [Bacteroidales bacterium]|nr:GNAT family N-acetyltransferase [Bacteroidales bacterium]